MDKIECQLCEQYFNLPLCIDKDDYDGEVCCKKCKALLHIKIKDGRLKKIKVVDKQKWVLDPDKFYQEVTELGEQIKLEERERLKKEQEKKK